MQFRTPAEPSGIHATTRPGPTLSVFRDLRVNQFFYALRVKSVEHGCPPPTVGSSIR
jgi:hypothetical protein